MLKLAAFGGRVASWYFPGHLQKAVVMRYGRCYMSPYDIAHDRNRRPPRDEIRIRKQLFRRKQPSQILYVAVGQDGVEVSSDDACKVLKLQRVPDVYLHLCPIATALPSIKAGERRVVQSLKILLLAPI